MKKIVFVLGLGLILMFGACTTSNKILPTPTIAQATNTISFPMATLVPTIDPLTPTAIAQFFHTQEASVKVTQSPTPLTYQECSQWNQLTADKNWALCDPGTDPITLINQSNQLWQFSYKTYYGKEVLNPCTRLLYSTNDGQYLYFSLDDECIMTEPGFVFSIGVFRMNLINGSVNEILKASFDFESNEDSYYSESISPTGRRMAYIYPQKSPLFLTIHDLQTGENRTFSLEEKYRYGGRFKWSDDGTKLVFMLESNLNDEFFISMVFIDLLKDNSIVTFIKDKDPSWIASQLEVMDKGVNVFPAGDTALYYDIETGVLSPISQ